MDKANQKKYIDKAIQYFEMANIIITENEKNHIEIADFGLNQFERFGLSILTYVNTERVCAKELILLPNQVCPEHKHPDTGEIKGKEETFRCRKGLVYLYVPGDENDFEMNKSKVPNGSLFTVFKEIILSEGEQYTLLPNTLHWFKAGTEGAVVSEFSTRSTDEADIFTDPHIIR